jgi:hypothetical protein
LFPGHAVKVSRRLGTRHLEPQAVWVEPTDKNASVSWNMNTNGLAQRNLTGLITMQCRRGFSRSGKSNGMPSTVLQGSWPWSSYTYQAIEAPCCNVHYHAPSLDGGGDVAWLQPL